MIDADLSCKYHTDYICHKISKSIGIVAKLRHYIPRPLLLNIYHTLIAPYMNYSICTWRSCAQVYQKRLLVLQKRAFRLIFFGLLENTQFVCSRTRSSLFCPCKMSFDTLRCCAGIKPGISAFMFRGKLQISLVQKGLVVT